MKDRLTDEQRDILAHNWEHIFGIAGDIAKLGTPPEELYDAAVETAMVTASHFKAGDATYPSFFAFCVRRTLFRHYQMRLRRQIYACLDDEISGHYKESDYDNKELAGKAMSLLNERQFDVMRMMFFGGMTENDVASKLKCTRQNVHNIKNTAIRKIRRAMPGLSHLE